MNTVERSFVYICVLHKRTFLQSTKRKRISACGTYNSNGIKIININNVSAIQYINHNSFKIEFNLRVEQTKQKE